ncbi:50S ribosomal protein L37ae [Candidatus Woesearchaeota archaeon]|nr:50S ribosomal protein L37ae [Candidatus Woesearchaeota archaeon]MBI2661141.1 50S ribosomal protein L37ae [Candidatus Woesearchaeota archaeon]
MADVKKYGSIKRFGARYGTKTKNNFGKIEYEQRRLHKCPYCSKIAVKRLAMGIWQCRKCKSKFVGKAYSVEKRVLAEEAPSQETQPEIIEEAESAEEARDTEEEIKAE